jgi:ring-1,2-phenylacetyl-CoA epoxidase subunit PaaE
MFYKLSIKEVKRETKNSVSIVFDIPANLQNEFKFIPGQYINVQFELDGNVLHRAYSICSSLKSKELRIGIKEVKGGAFSVHANNNLMAGDILEVSPPEGKFILNISDSNQYNYIAFAAGSGITPVLSMIRSVIETEKESKFVLVYGNKSSEDTMFKNEIDNLKLQYKDQFEVHYVFSQKVTNNAYSGRISLEILDDILKDKYPKGSFSNYFLCGPEEMINLIKSELLDIGIDKAAIKFELFSTSGTNEPTKDISGNSQITILLDDEETTFEMKKEDVILSAALLKGLDAPYSCQGGICSSCLAKVIEGEVIMDNNSILDEDELEEGLILTCQSHPVSSTIKIDYDDV